MAFLIASGYKYIGLALADQAPNSDVRVRADAEWSLLKIDLCIYEAISMCFVWLLYLL